MKRIILLALSLVLAGSLNATLSITSGGKYYFVCDLWESGSMMVGSQHSVATPNPDGATHSFTCTACDDPIVQAHAGGQATCTQPAVCTACDAAYGTVDAANHTGTLSAYTPTADNTRHARNNGKPYKHLCVITCRKQFLLNYIPHIFHPKN